MLPAKKSLGQNFLTSQTVVREMVDRSEASPNELILEIGPGKGILTSELLGRGATVVAIEKDDRMIPYLNAKFTDAMSDKKLFVVHGDVLDELLWEKIVATHDLRNVTFRVVANIPYYITGLIFRMFLEHGPQPKSLTLMVQKEVAHQIMARNGKESILSLSVKIYGTPHSKGSVKRTLFRPSPNVDSAIMHISSISKEQFSVHGITEQDFFATIHAGFHAKRKMLLNNISSYLKINKDRLATIFVDFGISEKARAEDLTLHDWVKLTKALH